jgi:hypothetical protein
MVIDVPFFFLAFQMNIMPGSAFLAFQMNIMPQYAGQCWDKTYFLHPKITDLS